MAYKMRGHLLPGINQRSEGNTDLPDGRSGSSPLQKSSPAKHKDTDAEYQAMRKKPPMEQRIGGPGRGEVGHKHPHAGQQGSTKGTWNSQSDYVASGNRWDKEGEDTRKNKKPVVRDKKSPAKCPLLAMAPAIIGAVGAMKKAKDSPAKQTKHTGKFGTTANLSKDGKKFTEFVSDPKSKSQSSTMTEFDLMTPKELAKAKINPKKTGVYTSKTGDKRTLS